MGCTGLTSVSMPSSITQMGESIFEGCTGLTSGDWSAKYIRPGTFLDCTGLTEFTIEEGVGEISSDAFSRCKNLKVIAKGAFDDCCPDDIFENAYVNYATLHVPTSVVEDYRTTTPWSEFGKIEAID